MESEETVSYRPPRLDQDFLGRMQAVLGLSLASQAHWRARFASEPVRPSTVGHRVTYPGEPRRRETRLLPLLICWAQRRCMAKDPVPWIAPAKRRRPA